MAITKIRATIGRAVVLGAATGMTLGLPAAPANASLKAKLILSTKAVVDNPTPGQPAPPQVDRGARACQVLLVKQISYQCFVHVEGILRTSSRLEAERLASSGFRIQMRLWGDDPVSDDFLYGPQTFSFRVNPCCAPAWATFKWGRWINSRELDEDHYPDRDEIYAGIRLVDSRGRTVQSVESNRWHANIGIPGTGLPVELP